MALTRDFKTTIKVRVQRDPTFRTALLRLIVGRYGIRYDFRAGDISTPVSASECAV